MKNEFLWTPGKRNTNGSKNPRCPSPDGETIAAIVNVDEGEFTVCVNGDVWGETIFDKIWHLRFSPDGRLTALVSEMGEWTMAVDGVAGEQIRLHLGAALQHRRYRNRRPGAAGHALCHRSERETLGADLRQHDLLCHEPGRPVTPPAPFRWRTWIRAKSINSRRAASPPPGEVVLRRGHALRRGTSGIWPSARTVCTWPLRFGSTFMIIPSP